MDIETTTELVIEKFKSVGGYSDMDDDALYTSIYGYLDEIFQNQLALVQTKVKAMEARGIFPDQEKYAEMYNAIEDVVMYYANRLAATHKSEI